MEEDWSMTVEFGIVHSIVSHFWRKLQTTGTAVRWFSSGFPWPTMPPNNQYIALLTWRNRCQTLKEIGKYMTQVTWPISCFTISMRLHIDYLFAQQPVQCAPSVSTHLINLFCDAENTRIGQIMGVEYSLYINSRFSLSRDSRPYTSGKSRESTIISLTQQSATFWVRRVKNYNFRNFKVFKEPQNFFLANNK